MNENMIITIGRQFGSGGREIGKALAEDLGISYYDKELLHVAAQESVTCYVTRHPAHWKFAFGEGLDALLAKFTRSYGLCSECKVLV